MPAKISIAIMAAMKPCRMLLMINGRRINPAVAPTSFIVWIKKRREYIVSLMVLFISTNEMSINAEEMSIRINAMLLMLLLIASIMSECTLISEMH